jgi:hypothetical protein
MVERYRPKLNGGKKPVDPSVKDPTNGHFVKGHKKIAGRKKGTMNRVAQAWKELIEQAAAQVGQDGKGKGGALGYLINVARKDYRTFCGLIGKVMPLQVNHSAQTVRVFHLDAERLRGASDAELEVLESFLTRADRGEVVSDTEAESGADPSNYEASLH